MYLTHCWNCFEKVPWISDKGALHRRFIGNVGFPFQRLWQRVRFFREISAFSFLFPSSICHPQASLSAAFSASISNSPIKEVTSFAPRILSTQSNLTAWTGSSVCLLPIRKLPKKGVTSNKYIGLQNNSIWDFSSTIGSSWLTFVFHLCGIISFQSLELYGWWSFPYLSS